MVILAYFTGIAVRGAGASVVEMPFHSSLERLEWVDLPEFGGAEAIIHRSPDGRRVAAAFRESGKASFTYPFDEFLYVTAGTATVKVKGGGEFMLRAGDVAYFKEGTAVEFDFSDDFADVTMLVADHEVRWR
jgi:uncharacterized cupin superfamily protein